MNLKKVGINAIVSITALTCVCKEMKSCKEQAELSIQNIKYEIIHNTQDSTFWTKHCGADYFAKEKEYKQDIINSYAKKEPWFYNKKIAFWNKVKAYVEGEQASSQLQQVRNEFENFKYKSDLRPVYYEVRKHTGKASYTTLVEKWVPKNVAEQLKKRYGCVDGLIVIRD